MRGLLIAVEGTDRAGKSTQCSLLCEWLGEIADAPSPLLIKFPDRSTPIGQIINEYLGSSESALNDQAIHLLFSANRWELAERILAALERGQSVILDRYVYSGVAYSTAKGLAADWCRAPDAGLPQPDLLLYLDLPVEEARMRGGYGEERYEREAFQASVRQCFLQLLGEGKDEMEIVSACGSVQEVQQRLRDAIISNLTRRGLWEEVARESIIKKINWIP